MSSGFKEDDNTKNNSTNDDSTTKKMINKTFDDAKKNVRNAVDETHRGLPRYMQTVTDNQEQAVFAARDSVENYLESQRKISNSFQTAWSSFFDNYIWMSPKKITETYARLVSSLSDITIATIRMGNNMMFTNTEATKMFMQYTRDNTSEMSRISVNAAKMLEETTTNKLQ
jgi:t-SNARE complex subunit (syntaxin)